jgi:halocyanin-like protein
MSQQRDRYDRRTVLQVAGATAFAGVLAGCTEDENGEADDGADPDPTDDEEDDVETDDDGTEDEEGEFVDDDEEPDYGDFMDDVPNYEGTLDLRGEEDVAVEVGAGDDGLLFEPPAVMVDPGTEVIWEWTGEGGEHNVVSESGEEFESDTTDEEGFTFEHTFEEPGVTEYVCEPHEAQGKKGVVAVDGEGEEADDEEEADDATEDDAGEDDE